MATYSNGALLEDDDPSLLAQPSYGSTPPGTSPPAATSPTMTPSYASATPQVQPQSTFFSAPTATTTSTNPSPTATPTAQTTSAPAPTSTTQSVTNTPPMLPGGSTDEQVNRYGEIVKALDAQTDPTARGIMVDSLARQLYNDLQNAGHTVKWQDQSTLLVDGRPYTVAGSHYADSAVKSQTQGGPAPADTSTTGGHSWDGLTGRALVNNADYAAYRLNEAWKQSHGGQDMPADRLNYFVQKALTPDIFTGGDRRSGISDYWIDRAVNPGSAGGSTADRGGDDTLLGWDEGGPAASYSGSAGGGGGGDITSGAANVDVNMPASPAMAPSWGLTGPTYQPGPIDTLDNFNAFAGTEDVDAATKAGILKLFEGGDVDKATQEAILKLLQNPESLDPKTVEMMKGKSREEAGALYEQQDEELKRAGFAGGFDDSRWLASEHVAGQRARDESIIGKNRDIDIQAATQNMQDRRAAIEQGASYASSKAQRDAAAVQAGQTYQQLHADTAIKTAALQGDRLALREQVNQKAAELGLTGDQLQLQYTLGLLENEMKKYGIDVGAGVDMAKLSQAGREFQEELVFKYTQLEQADAQFGASYGLQYDKFASDEDQRNINNTRISNGLPIS